MNELNEWKEAIIDECVMCHLNWFEDDPRKTLLQLIHWHIEVALDPRVSSEAQRLIDKGINIGRKEQND